MYLAMNDFHEKLQQARELGEQARSRSSEQLKQLVDRLSDEQHLTSQESAILESSRHELAYRYQLAKKLARQRRRAKRNK